MSGELALVWAVARRHHHRRNLQPTERIRAPTAPHRDTAQPSSTSLPHPNTSDEPNCALAYAVRAALAIGQSEGWFVAREGCVRCGKRDPQNESDQCYLKGSPLPAPGKEARGIGSTNRPERLVRHAWRAARHRHFETRTGPRFALNRDVAAQDIGEALHDIEAEPEPVPGARRPPEALEDTRQRVTRNSFARVGHREADRTPSGNLGRGHRNRAVHRMPQGIVHQVP